MMATLLPLHCPQSLLHRSRSSPPVVRTPPLKKPSSFFLSSSLQTPGPTAPDVLPSPSPSAEDTSSVAGALVGSGDLFGIRGCKTCGREEREKGCNGEGRIQGGIATVPGFGWWPIKAYRPCPGFVESGGRYKRQGQSMDEVVSGRAERERSLQAADTRREKVPKD